MAKKGKKKGGIFRLRRMGILLLFLAGSGAGIIAIGEKFADRVPSYQKLRAKAYFLKDKLPGVSDPTIHIDSPAAVSSSPYDNLSIGVPSMTDTVLDRRGYALGYSEEHEQPLWVSYTVTADEVRKKVTSRTDDFRPDPYIATGSATQEDYAKSGFDRGHIAPAADMAYSKKTMSESFYFSNMSPQRPDFNRGIWRMLEEKVRDWAVDFGKVHVVTGPVITVKAESIGSNKVTVPQAYYKVIYAPETKPPRMIGFVLGNTGSKRQLYEFAVTVRSVEAVTKLDFFPALDPALQNQLKTTVNPDLWKWSPNR